MKSRGSSFLVILPFLLVACASDELKFNKITVGMTYEEVEDILGKPSKIERGSPLLVPADLSGPTIPDWITRDFAQQSLSEMRRRLKLIDSVRFETQQFFAELQIDSALMKPYLADTVHAWQYPHVISWMGQLVQVTWQYQSFRYDTTFGFFKRFRKDSTLAESRTGYYLNDRRVTKDVWDAASTRTNDYLMQDGHIGTYGGADKGKFYDGAERIDRKYTQPFTPSTKLPVLVPAPSQKKRWLVKHVRSIVFDASSGRVVKTDYYPESITEL